MTRSIQSESPRVRVYPIANIRSEPDTKRGEDTIIRKVEQVEEFRVVDTVSGEVPGEGREGNDAWYLVELDNGKTGYLYSELASLV